MKKFVPQYYAGDKGALRFARLQDKLQKKIIKKDQKSVIWSIVPNLTGADFVPFEDNKRLPFGNGVLDQIILVHGFDVSDEREHLMAEAARVVRDHGVVDVIGWHKPYIKFDVPLWERERYRVALRILDMYSLRWRRFEKVQDLMTLTLSGDPPKKIPKATSIASCRQSAKTSL